jgi:hypothetical protein
MRGISDMDEEFVIHAALVEHLRQFRQDGVVFFNPASGEERTKRVDPKTGKVFCPGGTRLQRMGMRKGVPDLVILYSGWMKSPWSSPCNEWEFG